MTDQPALLYYESKVAEKLGVTRDELVSLRGSALKKEEGHWEQRGRDVLLSEDGILALAAHLGLLELPDLVGSEYAPEKEEAGEQLTVSKVYPNRNLIQALTSDGRAVNVQVPNNRNFRAGMPVKALPRPDRVDLYRIEGRCPRYPGRY